MRWESDNISANLKQDKQQKERHKIDKIFQDYRDWVELSMTTESEPYLKLIFVIQQA
ncbi:helicase domain protein [Arthrospira platensis C1]|nr:helicase domain protein [Arthrospira platensis C1]